MPSKPKFVTYYRVSTQKQGRSGLGLEAQRDAVEAYLRQHGGAEVASFTEVESGKLSDRPQLQAALLRCRQTRATLLVAKLDRLSRNAAFLMSLRDSGAKFQALDIPEANTLTLGLLAVLAQHERELISQRTRAAHAARASALGRKANTDRAGERAREIAPQIRAAREAGHASLRQVAAYLNGLDITTPRGKRWTATAVRNAEELMKRAG